MQADQRTLHHVQNVLVEVLSPDGQTRKQAEKTISELQDKPGFGIVILELISAMSNSSSPNDIAVRQSAAVLFKNVVKKKWSPAEDEIPIPESDRDGIKTHIIDLMCTTSRAVQQQLAEAVSIISKYDFPGKWLTLLPHLVEKMQSSDIHVVHGVLLTANSIMKRFRYAFKSDDLYEELLYCLKGFQEPLTELFVSCGPLLEKCEQSGSREDTVIVLEILRLISRIFFSLNWQDIPEFFEDNTGVWMPEFAKYVTYTNASLEDDSETAEPGPVEKLKASIIESLVLYVTKYEEMFADYLPKYTEIIWQLLVDVKAQPKFDTLATGAIKFLTSVSSKQMNMHLFNDEILQQIVEQIVVPNLMATENDEELFQDNPLDYIVKDIEGSDQDTRRRCAGELVRALLKFFSEKTTELCVSYITGMLKQYESTGCRDWRAKDGALHLVLAAAVMSTSSSQGAGSLNPNMDILEIFNVHVLPELHDSDVNARPIVKADAIKLICTFRSHFPAPFLLELLPHLVRHLSSEYIVVQTYAALCIEKFLTVKDAPADSSTTTVLSLTVTPGTLRLGKEAIAPLMGPLLSALFPVLQNEDLPENDYVMKCVMRILSIVGSEVMPVMEDVLEQLTNTLERVCRNPSNPHFNHYLFECIALLVRSACAPSASGTANEHAFEKFEALLFPPFQSILQLDVVEFVPYVFQVLGQLLSYRPVGGGLSPAYSDLFPPLLSPVLWIRRGNVPALTDLVLAYIYQGIEEIVQKSLLEGVLGVFQKLLASKATETYAFKLINAVVKKCPCDVMDGYLPMVFQLLLMRMQEHQTPQYSRLFVHFICCTACTGHGPVYVFNALESIQEGMTGLIITQVWAPNTEAFARAEASEVAQILAGGAVLLCESPVAEDSDMWGALVTALLGLARSSPTLAGDKGDDLLYDEEAEAREFDNTYSKLAYSHIAESDDSVGVKDFPAAQLKFLQQLAALCERQPGVYSAALQTILEDDDKNALGELLSEAGINLA